jgi:hypothetical protein
VIVRDVLSFMDYMAVRQKASSLEVTISHIKNFYGLVGLPFPENKFGALFLKSLGRTTGDGGMRSAVCPHDWLPMSLKLEKFSCWPDKELQDLVLCVWM